MNASEKTSGRLLNPVFLLTMLVSCLTGISYGVLSPALPIYMDSLKMGTDIAGTIVAVATLLSMFGRFFAGGWSDIISRKIILLAAIACSAAAFLLFCIAKTLPLLLIARCLQGVSGGIIMTILCTVAFDTLPPALMGTGIGIFSLADSLSQCFAPSIGTSLSAQGRFVLLFLIAAAASAAAFLVMFFIPVQPTERARERKLAIQNGTYRRKGFRFGDYLCKEALPAAFLLLMNGIIHAAVINYLSICGLSRGITSVAVFFTIDYICSTASRPICGRIADKLPLGVLLIPGYVFMGVSFVLIAFAHSLLPICIAGVLYGLAFGATQSAGQFAAIQSAGPEKRTIANSTYYVGGDVGLTLGAYGTGAVAAAAGYTFMFNGIAVVCAVTLLCWVGYALVQQKKKKRA